MLPSINLQLTDYTAFNGDLAAEPQILPDTDTPVAGFAEMLNQPVLIADPTAALATGEALPQDGNALPSDVSESLLMPAEITGQPIKGDGTEHRAPQGELPIVRMVPPSESSNQTALSMNPDAQVAAASIPTRPEQGQRAGMHTGAASVAAELESLVARPTTGNARAGVHTGASSVAAELEALVDKTTSASTRAGAHTGATAAVATPESPVAQPNGNPVITDRIRESIGETRQAAALERIENIIRPAIVLDSEAIKEGRPTVSGSSPDPLAGLVERWQGPSSAQLSGTTPQLISNTTGPLLGTHTSLTPAPTSLPTSINIPLQDAAWGDALSERVVFMTGQKIHNAQIRLNPANLGPITITVAVDDGAADVTFTAQHAVAREAIELAMPRLRELLSENGLQLGNASVAEQGVDQDAKGREAQEARDWNGVTGDVLENDEAEKIVPLRLPQGLLDTFA